MDNKIETFRDYFKNNFLQIISFISLIIGGIYFLLYLININYFPNLTFNDIIIISAIYFLIGLIFSLLLFLFFFVTEVFVYKYHQFTSNLEKKNSQLS
ncbi:hypothetical protein [Caminibacter pacificus]|uniref:Uncharacterized protein n=1 Tax=Caminibacter pacificus TaxID=1424653 RepID=A0AAJ4RDV6_9BACT|nr:hypothetical protein [Caminibacter pacificus]QCI28553.1 hypothetical protein C6V80_06135 [Caminibacter pacificus]ROR40720.1 hypothetical protein EDC58_0199 [Caminibacter pacificus]